MSNTKDYQQNLVYKAEGRVFDNFHNTTTKEVAVRKVREILVSEFVGNLIDEYDFVEDVEPDFRVVVDDKRYKYSQASEEELILANNARSLGIILHEIAHSLTTRNRDKDGFTYHGPHFTFIYLKLVEEYLGFDAWLDLSAAFISLGVDVKPTHLN